MSTKTSHSLLLAIALALAGGPAAAQVAAVPHNQPVRVDISEQPLGDALNALAKQAGLQVVFYSRVGEGVSAPRLVGEFSVADALARLLENTGLEYEFIDSDTVGVFDPKARKPRAGAAASPTALRLAQSDTAAERDPRPRQASVPGDADPADGRLEEIVVTAQKREERLQEVPVPVSAIRADALVASNQLRLQDYYTRIPGLSLTTGLRGEPFIAIRGVTSGSYSNPTVGVVIDDVAYGSSTGHGGGFAAPEIDPSDLARVEVLRGPQGTLYGASSLGGLLKYVTIDPTIDGVGGRLQTGTTSVRNGDGLGYSVRGSINVPLGDTLAIRASGFTRSEPGYIDDPSHGIEGINELDVSGGRLSALWRPSQDVSLKLSALMQESDRDGSPDVLQNSSAGDLQQSNLLGTGWYDREVEAYSAILTARLGHIDLTSLSGYSVNTIADAIDFPARIAAAQNFFGVAGASSYDDTRSRKFTQEVRFAAVGQTFDWLLGMFYTDEDTRNEQGILAVNPATGIPVGTLVAVPFPNTFREYAAFANVTFHVTERFDIQVGGRASRNEQTYDQTLFGAQIGATPVVSARAESQDDAFTYLLTPQFKVSPDLMVYARLASGYRTGAPNINAEPLGFPSQYDADQTQNYELGVKGNLAGGSLSFDASVYSIDWKDIQLLVRQSGFAYRANGNKARSRGVELSLESRPTQGLTIGGWVAWNDAELTENFPASSTVFGAAGDRLPQSARLSGSVSVDGTFALTDAVEGFCGASLSYVGDRLGDFTASSATRRQRFASYAQADLRAGINYETWAVNVFVNNVTDKRGIFTGNLLGTVSVVNYIQPRTIGLALTKTF